MEIKLENESLLDFEKIYKFMPYFVNNLENKYFNWVSKNGSDLERVVNRVYPYVARDYLDTLTYKDLKLRIKNHWDFISIISVLPLSNCKSLALFINSLDSSFLSSIIRTPQALSRVKNSFNNDELNQLLDKKLKGHSQNSSVDLASLSPEMREALIKDSGFDYVQSMTDNAKDFTTVMNCLSSTYQTAFIKFCGTYFFKRIITTKPEFEQVMFDLPCASRKVLLDILDADFFKVVKPYMNTLKPEISETHSSRFFKESEKPVTEIQVDSIKLRNVV